jgi:hypothetical protein
MIFKWQARMTPRRIASVFLPSPWAEKGIPMVSIESLDETHEFDFGRHHLSSSESEMIVSFKVCDTSIGEHQEKPLVSMRTNDFFQLLHFSNKIVEYGRTQGVSILIMNRKPIYHSYIVLYPCEVALKCG